MAHPIFEKRIANLISATLARAAEAETIGHPGLVGTYRELVLEGLLTPLLPAEFGVGTGKIVDSTGQTSRQIDLIIYHKNSLPPVMWSGRDGVFPIEACRYAIEVKSCLRSHMIKDIYASAKQLLKLKERRRSLGPLLIQTQIPIALFAFKSDVKGMLKELDRLWKLNKGGEANKSINVLCIASNGYAVFDEQINDWAGDEASDNYSHIIGFLIGIVNTLLAGGSSQNDMAYGPYLLDRNISGQETVTFR